MALSVSVRTPLKGASATRMFASLVMTAVVLAAIFFGFLATTGSPIYIAVGVGLVGGAALFARPDLAVWILLIGTLLVNGLVGLTVPQYGKVAWLFSMTGFFLLAASFLKVFEAQRLRQLWIPGFVSALFVLLFYSTITAAFFSDGLAEALVGFKRYYQLFGLVFFLSLLPLAVKSEHRIKYWLVAIFILFLLQLPFAIVQRVFLVPLREGLWKQGVVPIDIVSGTFEASLEGGGSSSIMVVFLAIGLAYVLTLLRDRMWPRKRALLAAVVIGAPLFLGETKIALVLLPLVFVLVFSRQIRRSPVTAILTLAVGAGLTLLLAWIYFSLLATQGNTFETQLEKAFAYNFGSVGYYDRYSLNRSSAIVFWWNEHGWENISNMFFGHGVGSSYSGAGSLVPGHLSRVYPYMAINLTTLSSLLWDVGLVGASLFGYVFLSAWKHATRLYWQEQDGFVRARLMAIRVSIAANAFTVLYSNSLVAGMSHETILAFTLGYLAWLVRKERFKTISQNT